MEYRVRVLDSMGYVRIRFVFECASDLEASTLANRWAGDDMHVEVWSGERLVSIFSGGAPKVLLAGPLPPAAPDDQPPSPKDDEDP